MAVQNFAFGAGTLWATPSGTNPTPIQIGTLQNVQVDFASSVVELHGSKQLPVAVGRGKMKVSGKAQFANIDARVMSELFFGVTSATGQVKIASGELGTVATGSVTVSNSATFVADLGVEVASTGVRLKRVASAPAAGEYSVANGVYTFNTTLNSTQVKIDYSYNVSASGTTVTMTNQNLGEQPVFGMTLVASYAGKQVTMTLNSCVATKHTFATKQEDFMIPDFEFSAFVDATDTLGKISVAS